MDILALIVIGLFAFLLVYILIDRVCKCVENEAQSRAMADIIINLDPAHMKDFLDWMKNL